MDSFSIRVFLETSICSGEVEDRFFLLLFFGVSGFGKFFKFWLIDSKLIKKELNRIPASYGF